GGRGLRTLEGHTEGVNAVALTADGKRAMSASADRTVAVWDIETGALIASFDTDFVVRTCAVAADGLTFVAADQQGCVHFLRLEKGSYRPRYFWSNESQRIVVCPPFVRVPETTSPKNSDKPQRPGACLCWGL